MKTKTTKTIISVLLVLLTVCNAAAAGVCAPAAFAADIGASAPGTIVSDIGASALGAFATDISASAPTAITAEMGAFVFALGVNVNSGPPPETIQPGIGDIPLAEYAPPAEEVTISGPAAVCRDIGILLGGGNGVDAVYLSAYTTRLQAVHITARLMGVEETAMEYDRAYNFFDANLVEYKTGRNLLAYLRVHPELGWQGDPAGNIDPYGNMTAQAMYKVMLSSLGYTVGDDFTWEDTVAFAGDRGLRAMAENSGYLTNGDVAAMLVETLKTRMKDSESTLCEVLTESGVIDGKAACAASMLPGSPGFEPLLTYKEGGPLLLHVEMDADKRKVCIRFNVALNPTYAKALKNYAYWTPETGYEPLPLQCQTSMADECTVAIQFPREGWVIVRDDVETDAFFTCIATEAKNELRVSGLFDVDAAPLPEIFIDVPAP